ncbi:MAG: type II secretion system F family protein [Candidatus Omnitrophica bacterium]|nr:type II secretion system F family protein [Candidatus Omnitrophota bacterium]
MPEFRYKAKEGPSKVVEGVVDAGNVDLAISKVINLGLTPIDISVNTHHEINPAKSATKGNFVFVKRFKQKDLVLFARQMSDLVGANVPMLKSLQLVESQTGNPYFKEIIKKMHKYVEDGGALSDALSQEKNIFSPLYVNMVRTGELSGKLDVVLSRLADYMEKEMDTTGKIRSSLAYPGLIMIVGALTVFFLLSFVIPRISSMFDDMDQALPLPTVILVKLGVFFSNFWWLMILLFISGAYYGHQYISSQKGRLWFDVLKLKLPFLGEFVKVDQIGRFSRTMATMLESGVPITMALNSVWPGLDNVILKSEIKKVAEEVTKGSSLRLALKRCSFFPEFALNMISVGEETGRLEQGFYKIADTFERQADEAVKTTLSLLGPLVLVFIVGIVGMVVIAMILPIFKMNLIIQ